VLDSVTLWCYFLLRLSEVGQREVIRVAGGLFARETVLDLTVICDSDTLRMSG